LVGLNLILALLTNVGQMALIAHMRQGKPKKTLC
jgi:hypothetical protein